MKRFWLAVAMAGSFYAASALALEPDVLFGKVSPSVWAVRTFDAQERLLSTGTAVAVGPGRLVTSCHVLTKASSFVIQQDNVTYGATLEYPDVERDLCQIKVANFRAPALPVAPRGSARVGQKVYVVGSPRGLENTLSEGMLSGLRSDKGADGRILQSTVTIAPGVSGGGLFDSDGRLLGIMTESVREGGGQSFAVPADFLAEIPDRAQAALSRRSRIEDGAPQKAATVRGTTDVLRPGHALEYVRTDKLTGNRSQVLYRLDRIADDELIFNMGGRVEKADGRVVSVNSPIGGYFDSSSPPGGWGRKDIKPGMRWHLDYVAVTGDRWRHELNAAVVGEHSMRVDGMELKVAQIVFTGWIYVSVGTGGSPVGTRFDATAWYAGDLGRIVRFEAEHRRSNANESIEFVRILR